jgi:hypothetical protein
MKRGYKAAAQFAEEADAVIFYNTVLEWYKNESVK